MKPHFLVYCDGSCDKGIGGLGVTIAHTDIPDGLYLSCGYLHTTNNRMELLGPILAVEYLLHARSPGDILIRSDSQYAIKCLTQWRISWKKHQWHKKHGEIKNLDLVQRYDTLIQDYPRRVSFEWIKGHNGEFGNEQVDGLADDGRMEAPFIHYQDEMQGQEAPWHILKDVWKGRKV